MLILPTAKKHAEEDERHYSTVLQLLLLDAQRVSLCIYLLLLSCVVCSCGGSCGLLTMQNASVVADKASPPACCFWWEITRGPHENATMTLCVHEDAGTDVVRDGLKVGRQKRCWMRLLKDLEVSSVHAEFRLIEGTDATAEANNKACARQVMICDLNSTNGTKLNGEPLVPRQEYVLTNQDLIRFGKTAVRFRVANQQVREDASSAAENGALEGKDDEKEQGEQHAADLKGDVCELTERHEARAETGSRTEPADPAEPATLDGTSVSEPSVPVVQEGPTNGDGGGGFTTDDDDVFEAPRRSHVAQLPVRTSSSASSAAKMTCMICGQWLGHLDVLEQQLHINGCLDGRNQPVENWRLPQQQNSGPGRNSSNNSNTQNQGKKRKRARAAAATTTIEDDEVAMALAMSKSMANKEQEVDMEMALLSGELAQIDTQMAKLAKKREALRKKMIKLERIKAKVRKSTVISPSEARVLFDLSRVLELLFPEPRSVAMEDLADSSAAFKRARLVAAKYAPQVKTGLDSDSSWRLPSMWLRASEQLYGHTERDLYRNSILLPFARVEVENAKDEILETGQAAEYISTVGEAEWFEQEEIDVPDSVKRIFPDWLENLAFLRQQSAEDLGEALQEMAQRRSDRLLDEPEAEDGTFFASRGVSRADEEQACTFFETTIAELICAKQSAAIAAGEKAEAACSVENELIVLDSDNDSDSCEELTEDTPTSLLENQVIAFQRDREDSA